jgi:hypothetical protein
MEGGCYEAISDAPDMCSPSNMEGGCCEAISFQTQNRSIFIRIQWLADMIETSVRLRLLAAPTSSKPQKEIQNKNKHNLH